MATAEQNFTSHLRAASEVHQTAPSEGSRVEEAMQKGKEAPSPVSLRNLFTHTESHPVVLDLACTKAFGNDWHYWEAPTLWAEIKRVFQSEISEQVRNKLQAIRTLYVSELPWSSWQVFEKISHALNGNPPDWSFMQAVGLEELYGTVDMIDQIRRAEWANEVKLYMAACVLGEDVFYVPSPLEFIQAEVSQPYFVCHDCGNSDPALFHDGVCDTCTLKFEGGSFLLGDYGKKPEGNKGKNLTVVLRYDPEPAERRWKEVSGLASNKVSLKETPVDVQVDKLLSARDYMNIRRRQLVEQITALKGWLGAS